MQPQPTVFTVDQTMRIEAARLAVEAHKDKQNINTDNVINLAFRIHKFMKGDNS